VSVKSWRSRLGISQEELAGRAGLHRTYVSDIERGARNVSLESIEKLARALKISVATLFSPGGKSSTAGSSEELVDILLVEDNADDVQLTLRALQEAKITNPIQVVRDGAEALHFLFCTGEYANRRADQRPQVILLDLGLPKISGLEVLRRIKADARTRSIPVVVLTGSRHDRDVLASKQLGTQAYIVKPVDFQNLSEVTPQLSLSWALLKHGNGPRESSESAALTR
ncbi:MAG TPA: response regulator, partial [Candidatus Limnocylindria bacterium]|nr:response regulator [Candidatus Limnocylindria bacterium]